MVIQHNIPAINAHRNLGINNNATAKNLEKLSSGYRINRAGDDAAGLAISEKMRGQIRGLQQATRNAENGISLIQTAEGGLNETHAILQRMRELSVQSANGTYQDQVDRAALDLEFQAIRSEVDRIASSTHYNGINLLDGTIGSSFTDTLTGIAAADNATGTFTGTENSYTITLDVVEKNGSVYVNVNGEKFEAIGTTVDIGKGLTLNLSGLGFTGSGIAAYGVEVVLDTTTKNAVTVTSVNAGNTARFSDGNNELTFQIGANGRADQEVGLYVENMSSANLGLVTHNVLNRDNAKAAITAIDAAINQVSMQRAGLGALQNRLEHTVNNLGVTTENLQAAESSIRDVDMAKEMMEFTKNSILVQASQAMLAQANALPQGVLSLLG